MNGQALALGIAAVAMWQALAHWFPYERFLDGRRAPALVNYVIGGLGVTAGCGVYAAVAGDWTVVAVVFVLFAASGLTVAACYVIDRVAHWRAYAQARQAMDQSASGAEESL